MAIAKLTGLDSFKQGFTSVRPTLFKITLPTVLQNIFLTKQKMTANAEDAYIYCKAASLPASTVQEIEVGYMGRKFYEHGDREFDPWDITIYNSQDFAMRSFFEMWMDQMNLHETNKQTVSGGPEGGHFDGGAATYYDYQHDVMIDQLDRRNNIIYTYKMVGAFPTKVSDIQMDFAQTNTIEEFTVTMRYQYWFAYDRHNTQIVEATS